MTHREGWVTVEASHGSVGTHYHLHEHYGNTSLTPCSERSLEQNKHYNSHIPIQCQLLVHIYESERLSMIQLYLRFVIVRHKVLGKVVQSRALVCSGASLAEH